MYAAGGRYGYQELHRRHTRGVSLIVHKARVLYIAIPWTIKCMHREKKKGLDDMLPIYSNTTHVGDMLWVDHCPSTRGCTCVYGMRGYAEVARERNNDMVVWGKKEGGG